MSRKALVCLLIIFLVSALGCSLASRGNQSAAGQVSLQANPSAVPSPTNLPVVEDIERIKEETPEPALAGSADITDSMIIPPAITDTIIVEAEGGLSLAGSDPDNNDGQQDGEEAKTGANDIVVLNTATATATPIPTPTDTPTPTPSLVAVSSGWPPILPDATDLESGDGYVYYITGSDIGAVADFYRHEMAGYGWAEMDEASLAAKLGLADFSTLIPVPEGGTLLIFSKDGGETLSFAIISKVAGKVGVNFFWLAE